MLCDSPSANAPINKYTDAPRGADWSVDQKWAQYSQVEHARWDRLFARQQDILKNRACDEFLSAMSALELSKNGIPDMARLSARLKRLTGWQVVPVAELVPDEIFFDHLSNKRFPAGAFIRPEAQFDYLQEPDVFHDIFGHVPMLANPVIAEFMHAYGKGGQRAIALGQLPNLARLYWYTVEFGLINTDDGIRIYGAGIASSPRESVFCLTDPSPNRIKLQIERIMRTNYIIDDFQRTYFVINSFEELLANCYRDFENVYQRVKEAPDIEAGAISPHDQILHKGTQDYFNKKQRAKA